MSKLYFLVYNKNNKNYGIIIRTLTADNKGRGQNWE